MKVLVRTGGNAKRNLLTLQKSLSDNPVRALKIQIERWPVDRVIPSGCNPRTHSPEQVAQIAASIWEFGFVNPILVGPDGGLIAGEGRLRRPGRRACVKFR